MMIPLYYIAKVLYVDDAGRKRVALIICTYSIIVAIVAILELFFKKNALYEYFITNNYYFRYRGYRPMSTQFNPVVLGTFLLGCLPFNFSLFANYKRRLTRILGLLSSFLSIAIIMLTFSRGVFLSYAAAGLFFLWVSKKKNLILFFIITLFSVITICSYQKSANLSRFGFNRLVMGSYDSIISEYRLDRVKMTARVLKDHPFFGIGFNNFRFRFDEYSGKQSKGEIYEFKIPDNMYLSFLAETGLIGTIGLLVFIFWILHEGLRKKAIIPLTALIGLLVNMGAYELFYWNNPFMLFCLLCGFIAGFITTSKNTANGKFMSPER